MTEHEDSRYRGWIRHSLKRAGFDQTGLAEVWHVDRTAVSKTLNGGRRLHVADIVWACRFFEETPPWLTIHASVDPGSIDAVVNDWLNRCFAYKGDIAGLAEYWGVDRSTVSKAASGGRSLTMGELHTAAEYFASNPPGFEFKGVPTDGHRLSYPLETGTYREDVPLRDKAFSIEPDPEYPLAHLRIYPVVGKGMEALEPRPILPGDLVVGLPVNELESLDEIPDGSLVIVRRDMGRRMVEWSVRRLRRTKTGLELASRSRDNFSPVKAKGFDDPKARVVAVVRRVIISV